MEMKYIMLEMPMGKDLKRTIPIVFPEVLVHSEVAEKILEMPMLNGAKVRSAGSVTFTGTLACHGRSSSLQLKPHEDDERVLKYHNYGYGIG